MPLPPEVLKSLQEKVVPSAATTVVLALLTPIAKSIQDKWLGDQRRALYKKLGELNRDSNELRKALRFSTAFSSELLLQQITERRARVLSGIACIEEKEAQRASAKTAPLTKLQSFFLLFSPRGIREWALVFMYYWAWISFIYIVGLLIYDCWETYPNHRGDWVTDIGLLGLTVVSFLVVIAYTRTRAIYLRNLRAGLLKPSINPPWYLKASLGVLWIPISVVVAAMKDVDAFDHSLNATVFISVLAYYTLMLLWIGFWIVVQTLRHMWQTRKVPASAPDECRS